MSAPSLADTTAQTQRYARALEQLAEMRACVETRGAHVVVVFPFPPEFGGWDVAKQAHWVENAQVGTAKAGDPEGLTRAIGRAYDSWKRSKET